MLPYIFNIYLSRKKNNNWIIFKIQDLIHTAHTFNYTPYSGELHLRCKNDVLCQDRLYPQLQTQWHGHPGQHLLQNQRETYDPQA